MARVINYRRHYPGVSAGIQLGDNSLPLQFSGTDNEVNNEWTKITATDGLTTSGDIVDKAEREIDGVVAEADKYTISPLYDKAYEISLVYEGSVNPITGTFLPSLFQS